MFKFPPWEDNHHWLGRNDNDKSRDIMGRCRANKFYGYNNGSFTILTRITNCRISVAFSLRQLSRIEDIIKQMTKQAQIYDELLEEASGLRHQLWQAVQDTFTNRIRYTSRRTA